MALIIFYGNGSGTIIVIHLNDRHAYKILNRKTLKNLKSSFGSRRSKITRTNDILFIKMYNRFLLYRRTYVSIFDAFK